MKCLLCDRLSLIHICRECQKKHLSPTIKERKTADGFSIYTFYSYSEIELFLKTKHKYIGYYIYRILAKNSFSLFAKEFEERAYVVGIDDVAVSGYSHTAILAKAMKTKNIKPLYGSLRAENKVSYSGQSLEFRLKNPRNFQYRGKKGIDIILLDDVITTGLTISEAVGVLRKEGCSPLFALTLADAKR
ncbi:ComF family protein [Nitrosophilus alvini]|uniref:ComF family protein n=1 Tax=Nitrosophilus alvini TaxID=2714855 RepID=UPI00190B4BDA|nr:ComF family protein [Nitrosophilus alvini]